MPMKDDRLRVARLNRVLTQRSLLGASRFLRLFAQVNFWWPQRARARLHSRCDFVSNPCRASRHLFLLFCPVIV